MKKALDLLHKEYSTAERLAFDPLYLLDRSLPAEDQELVGFLLAGLAYGRVEQIQKSARDLFTRLEAAGAGKNGRNLALFLRQATFHETLPAHLKGWKHRLNTEADLLSLFQILGKVVKNHGSLKGFMRSRRQTTSEQTLIEFTRGLAKLNSTAAPAKKKRWSGTGPQWFFANPEDGSSCKRLMLWLRWMVRSNEVDPGSWHIIEGEMPLLPQDLFIPLDTHIFRWAKKNRVVRRASPSWKSVVEISDYLRKLEPTDPLKYDFAIFQDSFERFRKKKSKRDA